MAASFIKGEDSGGGAGATRKVVAAKPVIGPGGAFIMLGVIHRDESGPGLLDHWLDAVKPDVITVEFSNYGMTFRKKWGPLYRQRIEEVCNRLKKDNAPCYDNALSMVFSYVEMPYEFERASRYGQDHNVPVLLVDMDLFSYLRLKEIEKLLSRENLEKLLSEDRGGETGYEHILARLFFENGVRTTAYTEEMRTRDRYMSGKIEAVSACYRGKRLLHICGWQHLQDPHNLYGPLNPTKVFIYDKTFCV